MPLKAIQADQKAAQHSHPLKQIPVLQPRHMTVIHYTVAYRESCATKCHLSGQLFTETAIFLSDQTIRHYRYDTTYRLGEKLKFLIHE